MIFEPTIEESELKFTFEKTNPILIDEKLCKIHGKPVEAVCWTDMIPICIDCILDS
jgi:hypothetical protein